MPEPHPIIVTGDITMDWNLARTRRSKSEQSFWSANDTTSTFWQRGGAPCWQTWSRRWRGSEENKQKQFDPPNGCTAQVSSGTSR